MYADAYAAWLRDFAADREMTLELEGIRGNDAEIQDRFYTALSFGTAGMRGVLGAGTNRMNVYTVRRATRGLADYIAGCDDGGDRPSPRERGVVIAYDSRRLSDRFALETARVLADSGVKAHLFPSLRPVPVLSFAVRALGAVAGVVITASHNPPQFNGYKVYWDDGAQLPPERADAVLALIERHGYAEPAPMDEATAREKGLLVTVDQDIDNAYIERIKTLSLRPDLLRAEGSALKLVYTPLYGSGCVPVCRVLREMGVTNLLVVREQEAPDGNFPTIKTPNPEEADAYRLAVQLADQKGADVCLATDPDCDRLGVAVRGKDGTFVQLSGNQIGCLLLEYILDARKKAGTLPKNALAVKSIVSTELARAICEPYGVQMVDTLTGFKFIAERIQQAETTGEHTFLFGFEESYGYLSSTFVRDKDAVNAALLFTELLLSLTRAGQTVWDKLDEIQRRHGYSVDRVVSVTLAGEDGVQRMRGIMDSLHGPGKAPRDIAGLSVLAARDYETGLRAPMGGAPEPMGLPKSNVVYFELENRCWVCVRPSGTEPKIKLYVNARAGGEAEAAALADRICTAAEALLK